MDKAAFLQRIRTAAHAGRAHRIAPVEIPVGVGYVGAQGDKCQQFAAEVDAAGGEARLVSDHVAAREALQVLLQRYKARTALMWEEQPVLARCGVDELLAESSIAVQTHATLAALSREEQRSLVLAAEIGITSCQFAIAETGTLVMCSRPGQERMASLVPPVHVAIVEAAQIVPDLLDVFDQLPAAGGALPSNITFITGPSKTGDIELQLTTGVHGPKHWHVIVIRDNNL